MSSMDCNTNKSALIAYGTETGNAHDYAEELGRILERIHFWVHVSGLDVVDTASTRASDHTKSVTDNFLRPR